MTLYIPCINSQCKRLNHPLQNLSKTLPKHQKPNWPGHLGALVFPYNAMPHSTTGYQPYQLMFGHKAQTPCDNWLGLSQYNCSESISKDSWIQQQYGMGCKQAGIDKHLTEYTKECCQIEPKSLEIPEGNLVLLCNHLEGHNKIQDKYKSEKFVVVGKCPEPNVYCIKPVNGNGPEQNLEQYQKVLVWEWFIFYF